MSKKAKVLWKKLFKGRYAIEKRVVGKLHEFRKIGDLKTTLEYCRNYQLFLQAEGLRAGPQDGVYELYEALKDRKDINDGNLEIFFGYMNDKFWYPHDGTNDQEAVRTYWLDTIMLVSKDKALLEKLLALFKWDFGDNDRIINQATGKVMPGVTFDEVDLEDFPDGRFAIRLWMD